MSLAGCLDKHGKAFSQAERAEIIAAAKTNVEDGMGEDEGARAAVEEFLKEAKADLKEVVDAISAKNDELDKRQVERSDAARRAFATKRNINPVKDSMFVAIAKLGGLDRQQAISTWDIDASDPNLITPVWGMPLLRTGGRSLDDMAEVLTEAGYLKERDLREFEDKFDQEKRGDPVFTQEGEEAKAQRDAQLQGEAEQDMQAERDAWAKEHGTPVEDAVTVEDLTRVGAEPSGETLAIAELMVAATAVDPVAAERIALQYEGDDAGLQKAVAALKEIIRGQGNVPQAVQRSEAGGGEAQRPGLALTGQTPAEVAAQAAQQAAQAAQAAAEAVKSAADSMRDHFALTGSNRSADEARARGQQELGDRRQNAAERKRVAEMSPEEMRKALLVDTLTGLGNRRAYDESAKLPSQVSIDVDSLKWINDNMGHQNGDEMLKAVGQAIAEATDQGYHVSGDEFVVQAQDQDAAEVIMAKVRERLAGATLEATLPDGTVITKQGLGISYGQGTTIQEAESGLRADKERREAAGERSSRGAEPSGVARKAAEGGEAEGQSPGQVAKEAPRPVAQPQELDYQRALDAHRGTSFSPEKRARTRQQEFAGDVNGLYEAVLPNAKTDEQKAILRSEVERYKQGYLSHMYALLGAESLTMSTMIAGPSNFPVARNQKRLDSARRRLEEFLEWRAKARQSVIRAVSDARTTEQAEGDAWDLLKRKIDRNIGVAKGIDDGSEPFDRSAFTNGISGRLKRLADNGETGLVRRALEYIRERQAGMNKPFFAERNSVWALGEKAEEAAAVEQPNGVETIAEYDGATVVNNHDEQRVQITFDTIPGPEIRNALKSAGWRWSPSNKAWQRQNTANAIASADQIIGNAFEKKSEGPKFSRNGIDDASGLAESSFRSALSAAFGKVVADRLTDSGIVVPVPNQSALPAHVVPYLRSGDTIYGFYDPQTDRTYAVLENLKPSDVKGLVLHEVGIHYGFQRMLGREKYNHILKRLDMLHGFGNKAVREARANAEAESTSADQVPEETLAYLVQNHPTLSLVREIIAAVKAFLYREFGILGDHLNDADMVMLARAAVMKAGLKQGTAFVGERQPAFSRAAAAMANALPSARAVFNDITHSDRKLNRVISKFNTPFHIAETHPDFKPVYDEAQDFTHDVSRIVNESADLAKDLLPRIESLADFKKQPPSNKDVNATADALYAGTLWGGGSPMEGRVWTDAELKSGRAIDQNGVSIKAFDPLNDQQIGLYRQALASVGNSLIEHSKSLIWRLAKMKKIYVNPGMDLSDVAQSARHSADDNISAAQSDLAIREAERNDRAPHATEAEAGELARQAQQDADRTQQVVDELEAFKESVSDIETKTKALVDRGYFPAMRFGQYAVNVDRATRDGREELFFGRYETQIAANIAKKQLEAEFPDARVTSGVMNEEAHKLFQGLNLDALQLFAEHMVDENGNPISSDPIMQQYFRVATTERSALKRQIHRKGTPGFSKDVPRALAQFTVSQATSASRNLHAAGMLEKVRGIKGGDLQAYATRYVRYLQDPQEESQALRGFLANYYILGSIAFGAVNMTQPILMTAPYLTQYTSWTKAMGQLGRAAKDLVTGRTNLTQDEKDAYTQASNDGVVSPQEIHQIRAETRASALGDSPLWQKLEGIAESKGIKLPGKLLMRKAAFLWGSIYSMTEQFNRGITFLASYRIAKAAGNTNAYEFARNAVDATQGVYARHNRPEVSRGSIGSVAMTFKQFNISYLELAKRLYDQHDKKPFAVLMLTLFALAGAEGLPFAEDIEDLIDTIGQWLGYATNSKKSVRKLAVDLLGPDIADVMLHGASAIPGVPMDVANRMGMHNIIPGSAMLKTSEPDKTKDILDILGPAATLFKNAGAALEGVATGKPGELKQLLPKAFQDVGKSVEMMETGSYRDQKGRKVMDVDALDAAVKFVGFQPSKVARETRLVGQNQQDIALHKVIEASIADKWARGISEKDPAQVAEAIKHWAQWNTDNKEMPIAITAAQVARRVKELQSSREQRFIKSAPREIRGQVAQDLR